MGRARSSKDTDEAEVESSGLAVRTNEFVLLVGQVALGGRQITLGGCKSLLSGLCVLRTRRQ